MALTFLQKFIRLHGIALGQSKISLAKRVDLVEHIASIEYFKEDIVVCQVIKEKQTVIVIKVTVDDDTLSAAHFRNAAQRLEVASQLVILLEVWYQLELEWAVSKTVYSLIEILNIECDRNEVESSDIN